MLGVRAWLMFTLCLQVADDEVRNAHHRALEEAEIAYNLSHGNVVNTLSHKLARLAGGGRGDGVTMFKLYMIQARCLSWIV
jgi:hypothetical protein